MIDVAEGFREVCQRIVGADKDTISWQEFKKELHDEALIMHLASLDLQVHNIQLFFNLVAGVGDEDEASIDRFVEGCMQMTGGVTAIDIQRQLYQTNLIHTDLKTLGHALLDKFKELQHSTSLHTLTYRK